MVRDAQDGVADAITALAGSMPLVYIHGAIFRSTFVMVTQIRHGERSDVRSEIDFENRVRAEVWSIHIGHVLDVDPEHVGHIVGHHVGPRTS